MGRPLPIPTLLYAWALMPGMRLPAKKSMAASALSAAGVVVSGKLISKVILISYRYYLLWRWI
jgi:hypothetical protein